MHGRAGKGIGLPRIGQGRKGQDRAWQTGRAGQGRARQDKGGLGSARQSRVGQDRAEYGLGGIR